MNYSDYDSDGYSSNEDADYVPSGEDCKHYGEVSAIQWRKRRTLSIINWAANDRQKHGYWHWWLLMALFPCVEIKHVKAEKFFESYECFFWFVSIQLFSNQIQIQTQTLTKWCTQPE